MNGPLVISLVTRGRAFIVIGTDSRNIARTVKTTLSIGGSSVHLNSHRGTFDSIERLHRKVREDNNLQDGEVEFLYRFNGRTFEVGVIGSWSQDGDREIVLMYSEDGQTYLLKEREPKWTENYFKPES